MLADVGQRLIFPPEIATSNLRPDIVLRSGSACLVHLVELTVPWEDAVDEAYERKKLWYAQLAAEAEQRGWRVRVYPVEKDCSIITAVLQLFPTGASQTMVTTATPHRVTTGSAFVYVCGSAISFLSHSAVLAGNLGSSFEVSLTLPAVRVGLSSQPLRPCCSSPA
ncbi:UNVERIFIED_CONTAM: hypothetical protein FKN15_033297 [Acipenser sinensis]